MGKSVVDQAFLPAENEFIPERVSDRLMESVTSFRALSDIYLPVSEGKVELPKIELAGYADRPAQPSGRLLESGRRLVEAVVEKIGDKEARREFYRYGKEFIRAARKQGISDREIAAFYDELSELIEFEGEGAVPARERILLARQIMKNAADSTGIDQGANPTCQVTALEVMIYARNPARAANLLKQVAIDGAYVTAAGKVIKVDRESLIPDRHARDVFDRDDSRNFATQIFNVVAINIELANRKTENKIEIYRNDPESGGRYYATDGNGNPKVILVDGRLANPRIPQITPEQMVGIHNAIVGQHDADVLIKHRDALAGQSDRGTIRIGSREEFASELARLKRQGKLPVAFLITTAREPFLSDKKVGVQPHLLTIRDYFPGKPARVEIDNQWGRDLDLLGKNALTVDEAYNLAAPASELVPYLQSQFNLTGDPVIALELAWTKRQVMKEEILPYEPETGSPGWKAWADRVRDNTEDYERNLINAIKYARRLWQLQKKNGRYDAKSEERFRKKLDMILLKGKMMSKFNKRILARLP